MKISKLTVGQGNVEIGGTIKEVGEARTFDRFGRQLKVADAVFEDDSGTIKLSLWNENADRFKAGDKVRIVNGYVNEFQGEKQLTAGKFGKIEKVEEDGVSEEAEGETAGEETGAQTESEEDETQIGEIEESAESEEPEA